MAGETVITVVGNLTADPELRFTPNGAAVANFTIASTPRTFDKARNEWVDGETLFIRSTVWREAAENVAESLVKGARVVAQGRLQARTYQDREGNNRTSWELQVDEVGPSLRYATAKVTRSTRGGQGGGYGFGGQGGQAPPQGGGWTQPGGGSPQPPQGGQGQAFPGPGAQGGQAPPASPQGGQGQAFPGPGAQGGQAPPASPQGGQTDAWSGQDWGGQSSGEPPF